MELGLVLSNSVAYASKEEAIRKEEKLVSIGALPTLISERRKVSLPEPYEIEKCNV